MEDWLGWMQFDPQSLMFYTLSNRTIMHGSIHIDLLEVRRMKMTKNAAVHLSLKTFPKRMLCIISSEVIKVFEDEIYLKDR